MKTFLKVLLAIAVASLPLYIPISQLLTLGYMGTGAYWITILTVPLILFVVVFISVRHVSQEQQRRKQEKRDANLRKDLKSLRKDTEDAESQEQAVERSAEYLDDLLERYGPPRMGWRTPPEDTPQEAAFNAAWGSSILAFFFLLFTSAIWFDFISSTSLPDAGSPTIVYDTQTQEMFTPNGMRVYLWQQPENYVVVAANRFSGSVTDHRAYQHDTAGMIVGHTTQTWESKFEFSYTVPRALRLKYFRQGVIPNHDNRMRIVFRDSVDAMYYRGLGTFETTSDLQAAVRQEVMNRCAASFGSESCPLNVRIHIPFFPRRGPVRSGPGNMQS